MEFSERLWQRRQPHLIYHGDRPRGDRKSIQNRFMEEDDHLVLATNAFGMGIDRLAMIQWGMKDIRLLIENDARFPQDFNSLAD